MMSGFDVSLGSAAGANCRRVMARTGPITATVRVPTSKSVANRLLVCALLADGQSTLSDIPDGDDVAALLSALGAVSRCTVDGSTVTVTGGRAHGPLLPESVDCRLAGTTSRFLTAVSVLSEQPVVIDGGSRLRDRPMRDLHDALGALGASVDPVGEKGHLPVRVSRGAVSGGSVEVRGDASSQFISALMLVAPLLPGGLRIDIIGSLVSRPYVEMTAAVMAMFSVHVDVDEQCVRVPEAAYRPVVASVEPDHSSAAFVVAAVLVAGGEVTIPGLGAARLQGDEQMLDIAEAMGASVRRGTDVTVSVAVDNDGRPLTSGVDVDMGSCSDLVPAVAVAALSARGTTRISGVGFIRNKESDRLGDLANEVRRAGGRITETSDGLMIESSSLVSACVATHDDHRLAMALALMSLSGVDIDIEDADVVSKSWPSYFESMASVLRLSDDDHYSRDMVESTSRPVVVAFDVDHTLTVADSVVPFMIRVAGRARFARIIATNIVDVVRRGLRRDRNGLKQLFAQQVFSGLNTDDVRSTGVEFASWVVASRMRADTATRLREHQEAGHVVLLVSASFGEYLHAVGDLLEVDAVLCTELETEGDLYTGRLVGNNCRGEEKRLRVQAWLEETGIGGSTIDFAYGDSDGDTQLLEMADIAVQVGRHDLGPLEPGTSPVVGDVGEHGVAR